MIIIEHIAGSTILVYRHPSCPVCPGQVIIGDRVIDRDDIAILEQRTPYPGRLVLQDGSIVDLPPRGLAWNRATWEAILAGPERVVI